MAESITVQQYKAAERAFTTEQAKKGFAFHAATYVVFNIVFIIGNLVTEPDILWFFYPLFGWGAGLAIHYIFGVHRLQGEITENQAEIEQRARKI